MDGEAAIQIESDMRYSDIIVPTMDTVRNAKLLELLLTNKQTVSGSSAALRTLTEPASRVTH